MGDVIDMATRRRIPPVLDDDGIVPCLRRTPFGGARHMFLCRRQGASQGQMLVSTEACRRCGGRPEPGEIEDGGAA